MEPEQTKPIEGAAPEAKSFDRPKRGPRGGNGPRGRSGGFSRPKPEFDQKIISIRRVTRVVSGGRRMSFSVAMIIGDRKGSVGFGTGKASDTALAIAKALKHARKNMITISMTKTGSIPYDIDAKFGSSRVMLMPNRGRGIVAGSTVRDIVILAGLKDITTKIYSRSKNGLNNAQATLKALGGISKKRQVNAIEEVQAFTQ